jgi:hypothetical protein
MGNMTLQILTKTYCCNDNKDNNVYNEDLESDNSNKDDDEEDKQLIQKIQSFTTDINGSCN